jgi:hypothetical protein
MARVPAKGKAPRRPLPAGKRATSSDFTVSLDKADPSPLDFINRRMEEQDKDRQE